MDYSILVNTCDKFEDCWYPFFQLFSVYWPEYSGTVYLNTEYKDFHFPEGKYHIESLKVCKSHNVPRSVPVTWSQCLKWALEAVDTDLILYLQEDYFLKDKVDHIGIQKYVSLLKNNVDIKCIYLHSHAVEKEGDELADGLWKVKANGWRLSCQAALWRKQELLDIIRIYESPWEFENFGNKRSIVMGHDYLTVNKKNEHQEYTLIPYVFTGIIKGKWLKEVVPLFEKHTINIDYSKRGFYSNDLKRSIVSMVKYRLNLIPKLFMTFRDLYQINKTKSFWELLTILIMRQNRFADL